MSKKFCAIVADPPWPFKDSLKMSDVKRGAQANYDTLTMQEIRELPVQRVCNRDGAVLCLWVPGSLLQDGLDTMKAWGFKHKQTYVWVKTKKETSKWGDLVRPKLQDQLAFGMGRLFRQTHEICLIGTSSNKIYRQLKNKSQRSVSLEPNLKHSAKPEALQESLEIMFPKARKLELFARRVRHGWICLGNEVCSGEDIRVSLAKL